MIKMLKSAILGALLLASGLLSAADKSLTIGVNNWAENIAVANMWKILLEEKGYEVKLQNADKALLYGGVARGKIDVTFEVWLPYLDEPAYAKVKDKVELVGPWFQEANMGLAVPDYVSIDSIDQLNDGKGNFGSGSAPTIFGIESGSSLIGVTTKAKDLYQLDYNVLASSESAMLLTLERAVKRKEPVVVTLWKPHWVWSKYKLHYLKDPKGIYGKSDAIYAISTKSFKSDHAEVERWMRQWKMDDTTLGGLMSEIIEKDQSKPAKGARAWIEANRGLTNEWLR